MRERLWAAFEKMLTGRVPAWQLVVMRGKYFAEVTEDDARRMIEEVSKLVIKAE